MAQGIGKRIAVIPVIAINIAFHAVGCLLRAVIPRQDVVVDIAVAQINGVEMGLPVGAAQGDGDAELVGVHHAVGIEVVILPAEHIVHMACRQVHTGAAAAHRYTVAHLEIVQVLGTHHAGQRNLVPHLRQVVVVVLHAEAIAPRRFTAVIIVRQVASLTFEVENLEQKVRRAMAAARLHGSCNLNAWNIVECQERLFELLRPYELSRADALHIGKEPAVKER